MYCITLPQVKNLIFHRWRLWTNCCLGTVAAFISLWTNFTFSGFRLISAHLKPIYLNWPSMWFSAKYTGRDKNLKMLLSPRQGTSCPLNDFGEKLARLRKFGYVWSSLNPKIGILQKNVFFLKNKSCFWPKCFLPYTNNEEIMFLTETLGGPKRELYLVREKLWLLKTYTLIPV